jgi:hypothetical protein
MKNLSLTLPANFEFEFWTGSQWSKIRLYTEICVPVKISSDDKHFTFRFRGPGGSKFTGRVLRSEVQMHIKMGDMKKVTVLLEQSDNKIPFL